MTRLLRLITRALRRPVVVNTYKVKQTDLRKKYVEKNTQLALEMGKPNPIRRA